MPLLCFTNEDIDLLISKSVDLFGIYAANTSVRVEIEGDFRNIFENNPSTASTIFKRFIEVAIRESKTFRTQDERLQAVNSAFLLRLASSLASLVSNPSQDVSARYFHLVYALLLNLIKSSFNRPLLHGLGRINMLLHNKKSAWCERMKEYIDSLGAKRQNESMIMMGVLYQHQRVEELLDVFVANFLTISNAEKIPAHMFTVFKAFLEDTSQSDFDEKVLPVANKYILRNKAAVVRIMLRMLHSVRHSLGCLIGSPFLATVLEEALSFAHNDKDKRLSYDCVEIVAIVVKKLSREAQVSDLFQMVQDFRVTYGGQRVSVCKVVGNFSETRMDLSVDMIKSFISFGFKITESLDREEYVKECYLSISRLCKARETAQFALGYLVAGLKNEKTKYGALSAIHSLMSNGFDVSLELFDQLNDIRASTAKLSTVHLYILALDIIVKLGGSRSMKLKLGEDEKTLLTHPNLLNKLDDVGEDFLLSLLPRAEIFTQLERRSLSEDVIAPVLTEKLSSGRRKSLFDFVKRSRELMTYLGIDNNVLILSEASHKGGRYKRLTVALLDTTVSLSKFKSDAVYQLLKACLYQPDAGQSLLEDVVSHAGPDMVNVVVSNSAVLLNIATAELIKATEAQDIFGIQNVIACVLSMTLSDGNYEEDMCAVLAQRLFEDFYVKVGLERSVGNLTGNSVRMYVLPDDAYQKGTKEYKFMVKMKQEVHGKLILPTRKLLGLFELISKMKSLKDLVEWYVFPLVCSAISLLGEHELTRPIVANWVSQVLGNSLLINTYGYPFYIRDILVASINSSKKVNKEISARSFLLILAEIGTGISPPLLYFLLKTVLSIVRIEEVPSNGLAGFLALISAAFHSAEGNPHAIQFGRGSFSIPLVQDVLQLVSRCKKSEEFDMSSVLLFCKHYIGYAQIIRDMLPDLVRMAQESSSKLANLCLSVLLVVSNTAEMRSFATESPEFLGKIYLIALANSYEEEISDVSISLLKQISALLPDATDTGGVSSLEGAVATLNQDDIRNLVSMLASSGLRIRKNVLKCLFHTMDVDKKTKKKDGVIQYAISSNVQEVFYSKGEKCSLGVRIDMIRALRSTVKFTRKSEVLETIMINFIHEVLLSLRTKNDHRPLYEEVVALGKHIVDYKRRDARFLYKCRVHIDDVLKNEGKEVLVAGYGTIGVELVRAYDVELFTETVDSNDAISDPNHVSMGEFAGSVFNTLFSHSPFVLGEMERHLYPIFSKVSLNEDDILNLFFARLFSEDAMERKGAAIGVASFVKGKGVQTLRKCNIFSRLSAGVASEVVSMRSGSLACIGALLRAVGAEMHDLLSDITSILLQGISDKSGEIRRASTSSVKIFMSVMTPDVVKYAEGPLLEYLSSRKYRTKLACLGILEHLVELSKSSLSLLLPVVVPKLVPLLNDSHQDVRNGAKSVFLKLEFTLSSPTLRKGFPLLVSALEDPNKHNSRAIDMLYESANEIGFEGEQSLCIVLPIVMIGLKSTSSGIKKKSVTLASKCLLGMHDQDVEGQFASDLLETLLSLLYDFDPDIRRISAESVGLIISSMPSERRSNHKDMKPRLLEKATNSVSILDRNGASQCLAHFSFGMGQEGIDEIIEEFSNEMNYKWSMREGTKSYSDDNIFIEGWMSVIYYIYTIREMYPKVDVNRHIISLLPVVVRVIAEKSEGVSTAGISAGSVIIDTIMSTDFDKEAFARELNVLILDSEWVMRCAALSLIGEYLLKLVDVEEEADGDLTKTVSKRYHLATLSNKLGTTMRNELLAAICLLRFDVSREVAIVALQIWKNLIEDIRGILQELLPVLLDHAPFYLDFDEHEFKGAMYTECIGDILSVVDSAAFTQALHVLETEASANRVGVSRAILEIIKSAPYALIAGSVSVFQHFLLDMMVEGDERTVEIFGEIFSALSLKVGRTATQATQETIMDILREISSEKVATEGIVGTQIQNEKLQNLLPNLLQLVKVRPETILPDLMPQLTTSPLSAVRISVLSRLYAECGELLSNYVSRTVTSIFETMNAQLELVNYDEYHEDIISLFEILVSNVRGKGASSFITEILNAYAVFPPIHIRTLISNGVLVFARSNEDLNRGQFLLDTLLVTNRFLADAEMAMTSTALDILDALADRVLPEDISEFMPKMRRSLEYELSTAHSQDKRKEGDTIVGVFHFRNDANVSIFNNILFRAVKTGINVYEAARMVKLVVLCLKDDNFKAEARTLTGSIINHLSMLENKDAKAVFIESLGLCMRRSKELGVDLSIFQFNIKKELLYGVRDENNDVRTSSKDGLLAFMRNLADEKKIINFVKDIVELLGEEYPRVRAAALVIAKDTLLRHRKLIPADSLGPLADRLENALTVEVETNLLLAAENLSFIMLLLDEEQFEMKFRDLVYISYDDVITNCRQEEYYGKYLLLQYLVRRRPFQVYDKVREMILAGLKCDNHKLVFLSISMFTVLNEKGVDIEYNELLREIARLCDGIGEIKKLANIALKRYTMT